MFQIAFLNNMRALITIYDKLLPRSYFIMLPGDEIVEKKHANIKILTAQKESADLSRKPTKKWPGLGPNVFEVDYAELFDNYKEYRSEEKPGTPAPVVPPTQPPGKGAALIPETPAINTINQISAEVEVKNTEFHKSIIKSRNEYYSQYKTRFLSSINSIMKNYDELRAEEVAFNNYWNDNLEEITQKHI
jgi:hypothetical protein